MPGSSPRRCGSASSWWRWPPCCWSSASARSAACRSTSSPSSRRRWSRSRPKRPACRPRRSRASSRVPLENALNGTPWLKTIRSKSVLGLSSVVLIFEEGTDLMQARQLVQERLATVAAAPAGRRPAAGDPVAAVVDQPGVKIGVSSKTLSQMELTMLALWTIRPRLMAVPGVANVAIWGQRDRQFQVLVDPDRLRAHGVTLDAVVRGGGDAAVARRPAASSTRRTSGSPSRHARPIVDAGGPGRTRRSPSAAARRCGSATWPTSSIGYPAADRRRGHQRRPGPAADRREAALGQHARGHARRRGGARRAAARPARTSRSTPTIFRPATFIEHVARRT